MRRRGIIVSAFHLGFMDRQQQWVSPKSRWQQVRAGLSSTLREQEADAMGYHDPATFVDMARSDLLKLQNTLRETQQLIRQSFEFLTKREPHQLPAPPKIDNGPVKYVNMDAPRTHW